MDEKRLGELTEQEVKRMIDGVLDPAFDAMAIDEFFTTLFLMSDASKKCR